MTTVSYAVAMDKLSELKSPAASDPTLLTGGASVPRSVTRIMGLLEILARDPAGSTLVQLSQELKTPKSSLLMLLRPFVSEGYLIRVDGRYLLGPLMFQLTAQMLDQRRPQRLLRPFLEELAERSQESVYVVVLDDQAMVATYLDTIPSPKMIRFAVRVGFIRPLYATAAGRLLLAFQDAAWEDDYFKRITLEPLTPHTNLDVVAVRKELIAIRNSGLAVTVDESVEGGGAVAAAVRDPLGRVEAALTIAAPTSRLRENLPAFQEMILEIARRASGTLPNVR